MKIGNVNQIHKSTFLDNTTYYKISILMCKMQAKTEVWALNRMERWFLQGEFRPLFHETPLFRTIGEIGWTSGGPGGVQTTVEFGCTTRTAIPTLSPSKHLAILNKLFAVKSDCQVVLVGQKKAILKNKKQQQPEKTKKGLKEQNFIFSFLFHAI